MHLKYICITSGEIDIFNAYFMPISKIPIPKLLKNDVWVYHTTSPKNAKFSIIF